MLVVTLLCREVVILNRSFPRAEALAGEFPEVKAELRLMPDLMRSVAESDVVFAASGSEHILIHGRDLQDMAPASSSVGGVRRFAHCCDISDIAAYHCCCKSVNKLAFFLVLVRSFVFIAFATVESGYEGAWFLLIASTKQDGRGLHHWPLRDAFYHFRWIASACRLHTPGSQLSACVQVF